MSSGGARARSGPAPDPNALRRDRPSDRDGWTTLPAEGRAGDPPPWPLADRTEREDELWISEWKRPQAIQWERTGASLEVALFVRNLALVEMPDAPVNLGTLVKQQMEGLGISQDGLAKRRWRIAVDEVSERRTEKPAAPAKKSARDRFKVVTDEPGA